MKFENLYKIIEKSRYYVFSHEDIMTWFPDEKESSLKKAIGRWIEKGRISSLKRGLYELTYPGEFNISDLYVANKLYNPSYISMETALSNYSIIPEVSMAVTSITTKPTRRFKNRHGLFLYRAVKPKFFTGYYVEKQGLFDILIAEPEKAIIDYLYFKTYHNNKFNIKDERIDKSATSRLKKNKLKKYAKLCNINLKEFYAYL